MMRFLAMLFLLVPGVVHAQDRVPSHCIALASTVPGVQVAALGGLPDLRIEDVRLHYIGHSTFLIETAGGLKIATDFTGFVGRNILPDVVTMNRAHSSHYTDYPDPAIPHVLRGWGDGAKPADHHLDLGEILIRNVTTDIRGGFDGRIANGNSIFVFELGGLCIGHLGHLHHEPSEEQYAMIGRLDVVMAPVDGGMTVPTPLMVKILKRLRSSLVLPMHWFGDGTLQAFAAGMQDAFDIDWTGENHTTISLRELPRRPTVRVLMPRYIAEQE